VDSSRPFLEHTYPFIHEGGTFGIIFSLVVVVIAALNLILDFDFIEQGVTHQAPKPWNGTRISLLVTLIWMYLEILRCWRKCGWHDSDFEKEMNP